MMFRSGYRCLTSASSTKTLTLTVSVGIGGFCWNRRCLNRPLSLSSPPLGQLHIQIRCFRYRLCWLLGFFFETIGISMENAFEICNCLDERKVLYASFMLRGEALYWGDTVVESRGKEEITKMAWDQFKELIYNHFCQEELQSRMEREFVKLKQGDMSVQEYTVVAIGLILGSLFAVMFFTSPTQPAR